VFLAVGSSRFCACTGVADDDLSDVGDVDSDAEGEAGETASQPEFDEFDDEEY
jgi:hypothetical protein